MLIRPASLRQGRFSGWPNRKTSGRASVPLVAGRFGWPLKREQSLKRGKENRTPPIAIRHSSTPGIAPTDA